MKGALTRLTSKTIEYDLVRYTTNACVLHRLIFKIVEFGPVSVSEENYQRVTVQFAAAAAALLLGLLCSCANLLQPQHAAAIVSCRTNVLAAGLKFNAYIQIYFIEKKNNRT